MGADLEEIRERLRVIEEDLSDLALLRLRDSIDNGGTELPLDERRITRARRSVEKAIALLSNGSVSPED